MVAYSVDVKYTKEIGASAFSVLSACNGAAMVVAGLLSDMYSPSHLLAGMFVLRGLLPFTRLLGSGNFDLFMDFPRIFWYCGLLSCTSNNCTLPELFPVACRVCYGDTAPAALAWGSPRQRSRRIYFQYIGVLFCGITRMCGIMLYDRMYAVLSDSPSVNTQQKSYAGATRLQHSDCRCRC